MLPTICTLVKAGDEKKRFYREFFVKISKSCFQRWQLEVWLARQTSGTRFGGNLRTSSARNASAQLLENASGSEHANEPMRANVHKSQSNSRIPPTIAWGRSLQPLFHTQSSRRGPLFLGNEDAPTHERSLIMLWYRLQVKNQLPHNAEKSLPWSR